ncbi:uncharacterized protein [Enoplosus armatus]|uniref:uncharacterized protein n=1 Tax=Enoplosus armatus TaxID=215367 RepID=UPI003995ECE9
MNWDNQLSSILSVADGSVAKMRERLTSPGKFAKGGEEEVRRLRERVREGDESRRGQSPGAERRMEQWRREVGRELSSLRGHFTRATSLGNLEESFSSKLHREELEHLRREVDQLKTRLRRQEEDVFLQQAETRETRRQYEHSCKTLEELTDSYRTHSTDLAKTVSQYSRTQEEVRQMRYARERVHVCACLG